MGRRPISQSAMSGAERQRRYMERRISSSAPKPSLTELDDARSRIAQLEARIRELEDSRSDGVRETARTQAQAAKALKVRIRELETALARDRQMNALSEHVSTITVDTIIVKERLRPLRDDVVVDLMASMSAIGLIHPITIWRPDGRVVPELISGAHRLEAARRLGWSAIPCFTAPEDDADRARLIEIDENLRRSDLSPAERGVHLRRRAATSG
jgi:hypothetical protein